MTKAQLLLLKKQNPLLQKNKACTYLPGESKVIYESKDSKGEKIFDALEWLAAMISHMPDKGEQIVR